MGSGFSGDVGLWQRRVAEGPEGIARRMAVFDALEPRPGQSMLDLGCGGGHLTRDIARAVGQNGRAVGLDASADQITAAQTVCEGLSQVELITGDALALPFDDGVFDGMGSIQVLDYIDDTDRALRETRRVMKTGAKAAIVCVLWDHFRFHGAEPKLDARMMEAFRAHCPHQMLPLELPNKLLDAGFGGVTRRPLPIFNGSLHENAASFWLSKLVAMFGMSRGIPAQDANDWLTQLALADREGRFGFVSTPALTTATAI